MAAIVAPDMPREGRVHNPRHLSLPIGGMLELKESINSTDALASSSSPPPNPPFVFPSKPMAASTPRAKGRRPRSVIDIPTQALGLHDNTSSRQAGTSELPAFSFNPGAGLSPPLSSKTADDLLSPPRSPRLSPSRAGHGHKRGGSEFVGGEYRSGSARMELLDSSPTRPETVLTSPQSEPTRRGPAHRHAHRRSAAMSSHDLNSVLGLNLPKNPGEISRGSSAPSSPSGPELNKHFSFPLLRPADVQQQSERGFASQPGGDVSDQAQASPVAVSEPTSAKSFGKARVGFSDTLEFIPRPLSLVSSDASSTATVRPGHSVSGSISSMISISNSIILEESTPLESSPSQVGSESRPSTAGAILDRSQSQPEQIPEADRQRRGSMPLLTDIALSAPGPSSAEPSPSKYSKKWSLFSFDQKSGSSSPSKSRPSSLNSGDATKEGDSASSLVESQKDRELGDCTQCTTKAVKKSSKKQKKVKKWAGSILTRPKDHHRKGKKPVRRGPTPPPPRHTSEDDEDNVSDSADTKSEPSMPTVMITELDDEFHGDAESWKPPRPFTDDDTSFPMIDLDAALGPFNTPLPRNPEWEAAQKAGGLMRRQLHSAAGMSRFSGPGGHYVHHQRAQSSPEMPPFEFRRGMNRFGSSSTMADVFEEDEEGDSEGGNESGSSTPQPESVGGMRDSEASSICENSYARASAERLAAVEEPPVTRQKTCDLEDNKPQRTGSVKSACSLNSIQEQVVQEDICSPSFRTVEFGGPVQHRLLSAPDSPMSSPVSPRVPLESSSSHTTASSLAPISPYSTTASSSMPSPRSPFYDSNIISTAPSSATDDSFQSLLMGEPGPEVRKSLDVPSLASSHSTQPRDNLFAQQAAQMNRPLAPGERPASFSMIGFGSRRGSLASLSRLISSSHGERSKLSLEVSFTDSDKKPKESKPKRRLSRMVQFWKNKESKQANA
ncbi:hypothetical protein BD289DRAFT_89952 [Coniella lustricola]|uniref:Cell wall proline rich protein n=1 Tax=Coniella lustricola TaxID=2025994 RepID=A0A2T3AGX1_9PEZI|nr:hypothetical protein BD289DRAFT_89952 [Coniella lustricola]